MATKENILLVSAVLGAALSMAWIVYAIYQQRKTDRIQRAIVQALNQDISHLEHIVERLRNLELSQCTNPAVSGNPNLAALLNCPNALPQQQQQQPIAAGQVSPSSPLSNVQTQSMMQQIPGFGVRVGNQIVNSSLSNMPPMPNYGFFGTGPSGLSDQFQHPQQLLLTGATSHNIPVPFR